MKRVDIKPPLIARKEEKINFVRGVNSNTYPWFDKFVLTILELDTWAQFNYCRKQHDSGKFNRIDNWFIRWY